MVYIAYIITDLAITQERDTSRFVVTHVHIKTIKVSIFNRKMVILEVVGQTIIKIFNVKLYWRILVWLARLGEFPNSSAHILNLQASTVKLVVLYTVVNA